MWGRGWVEPCIQPFSLTPLYPGYVGGTYGRSLGVRRAGGRQPLHDPDAEGALVLHEPVLLSEHEKLKVFRNFDSFVGSYLLCFVLRNVLFYLSGLENINIFV